MDDMNNEDVFSTTKLSNEMDTLQDEFTGPIKSDVLADSIVNDNLYLEEDIYCAPVEIMSEFLSTLMSRNYKSALYYCKLILLYEPDNEIVQDFYPLIQDKMHLDLSDSDDLEDECSSMESDSSTEYFSSTSVETQNMSSVSSEEEESSSE